VQNATSRLGGAFPKPSKSTGLSGRQLAECHWLPGQAAVRETICSNAMAPARPDHSTNDQYVTLPADRTSRGQQGSNRISCALRTFSTLAVSSHILGGCPGRSIPAQKCSGFPIALAGECQLRWGLCYALETMGKSTLYRVNWFRNERLLGTEPWNGPTLDVVKKRARAMVADDHADRVEVWKAGGELVFQHPGRQRRG